MKSDDMDFIERKHGVNIDVTDEDGFTTVYTYTEDGDRLGFQFNTMNPDPLDVLTVAAAIDALRAVANKRPRVGRQQ